MVRDACHAEGITGHEATIARILYECLELRDSHGPARDVVRGQLDRMPRLFVMVHIVVGPLVTPHGERALADLDEPEHRIVGKKPPVLAEPRIANAPECRAGECAIARRSTPTQGLYTGESQFV